MSKQKLRERLQKSIKWYQQKQSLHWREQLDTGMDIGELMWRTEIMMWYTNVRIIHNALTDKANISTHSEGEEPNRYLVIDYVD